MTHRIGAEVYLGLADELCALEAQLLTPSVRKNAAKVNAMLANEFREFGASGRVYNKAETVDALQMETGAAVAMEDFACVEVSDGVVLVTYRSVHESGADAMRSSLWVWRDARWQMVFHQGTKRVGQYGIRSLRAKGL